MTKTIYLFRNCVGDFILNINCAPNYDGFPKLESVVQKTHQEIKSTPSVLRLYDYGGYLDACWVRDYRVVFGVPQNYPGSRFVSLSEKQKDYIRRSIRHRGPEIPDGSLFGPLMPG